MSAAPSAGPDLDRRYAFAALIAVPVLTGLALGLSVALGGLAAAVIVLLLYWAVLGGALLAWADRDWLFEWLRARSPGRLPTLVLALPVILFGAVTLRLLGDDPLPPHLVVAAGLAAMGGAVIEELFWRGALIPEPAPRSAALALGLYVVAQVPWLGILGLVLPLPSPLLLLAALALGGAWTAARLLSGTVGAAVMSHAGLNLFLFVQVLALNT